MAVSPAWSPDAQQLAFGRVAWDGSVDAAEVWITEAVRRYPGVNALLEPYVVEQHTAEFPGIEIGNDSWTEKDSGAPHSDVYLRSKERSQIERFLESLHG